MSRPASLFVIAFLSLSCQATLAQPEPDTSEYDAKWSATWQTAAGAKYAARVVVFNYGGTWQDVPLKGSPVNKACRGKTFPITVQRSVANELQFMVWGTSVADACPDLELNLKPIDAKTLEGTIGGGMKIKMTRR